MAGQNPRQASAMAVDRFARWQPKFSGPYGMHFDLARVWSAEC